MCIRDRTAPASSSCATWAWSLPWRSTGTSRNRASLCRDVGRRRDFIHSSRGTPPSRKNNVVGTSEKAPEAADLIYRLAVMMLSLRSGSRRSAHDEATLSSAPALARHHRTTGTSADSASHTRHGGDQAHDPYRPRHARKRQEVRWAAHGTSLTRLVTSHLERLEAGDAATGEAPVTRRLTGALPPEASPHDYHEDIERKHA